MKTNIIYEDTEVLVVHKPAGLATQTDKLGQADVVSELKKYLYRKDKNSYLGIIHRLDQPVEGLLVFAKNKEAAAKLSRQIETASLKKYYYALVSGQPKKEEILEDYIMKTSNHTGIVIDKKDEQKELAKKAKLKYICCQTWQGEETEKYSLVKVELFTGRFHQIRVQMSHAGYPLLGDQKYGTETALETAKKLALKNTALFAYSIQFQHPKTAKKMEFSLPLPEDWQRAGIRESM